MGASTPCGPYQPRAWFLSALHPLTISVQGCRAEAATRLWPQQALGASQPLLVCRDSPGGPPCQPPSQSL